jgi:hypothetical protein
MGTFPAIAHAVAIRIGIGCARRQRRPAADLRRAVDYRAQAGQEVGDDSLVRSVPRKRAAKGQDVAHRLFSAGTVD